MSFNTNICTGCKAQNCQNCDYVRFFQQQQEEESIPAQAKKQIEKWASALRDFLSQR